MEDNNQQFWLYTHFWFEKPFYALAVILLHSLLAVMTGFWILQLGKPSASCSVIEIPGWVYGSCEQTAVILHSTSFESIPSWSLVVLRSVHESGIWLTPDSHFWSWVISCGISFMMYDSWRNCKGHRRTTIYFYDWRNSTALNTMALKTNCYKSYLSWMFLKIFRHGNIMSVSGAMKAFSLVLAMWYSLGGRRWCYFCYLIKLLKTSFSTLLWIDKHIVFEAQNEFSQAFQHSHHQLQAHY